MSVAVYVATKESESHEQAGHRSIENYHSQNTPYRTAYDADRYAGEYSSYKVWLNSVSLPMTAVTL